MLVPEDLGIPWAAKIIEHEETGCWLWVGCWGDRSYGLVYYQGHNTTAHRAVYQFVNGPIGSDMVVDHLCRVHPCVNPEHLEAVSQSKNVLRGVVPDLLRDRHKSRTHCRNRHELTEANVRLRIIDGMEHRVCRACVRDSMRRARAAKKAAAA